MPDFTVRNYGLDSGGRTLWMTVYMHDWWEDVVKELGFRPTIVQGAFQSKNGGGADASEGYHDYGGCLDIRTWDLTSPQQQTLVRTLRRNGAGAWIRDAQHGGMDPHLHFVLGTDQPIDSGARWQWSEYIAGRDGLASRGADYHWRPDPLVTIPPKEMDDMFEPADRKKLDQILEISKASREREVALRKNLLKVIKQLDETSTKEQVKKAREDISALAESLASE